MEMSRNKTIFAALEERKVCKLNALEENEQYNKKRWNKMDKEFIAINLIK